MSSRPPSSRTLSAKENSAQITQKAWSGTISPPGRLLVAVRVALLPAEQPAEERADRREPAEHDEADDLPEAFEQARARRRGGRAADDQRREPVFGDAVTLAELGVALARDEVEIAQRGL